MSLEKVCRACLRTSQTMCSVVEAIVPKFNSSADSVLDLWNMFDKMLTSYTNGIPNKICNECLDEIQRLYSFILRCKRSEDIFSKIKNVKICLKKEKTASVLPEDGLKNIKSEDNLYPNILQVTEHFELNDNENGYDEEDVDNAFLEANIHPKVVSQVDPKPQQTLIVQHEDESFRIEIFDHSDCENDATNDEVAAIQDNKHPLNTGIKSDEIITKHYTSTSTKRQPAKCNLCSKIFVCVSTLNRHLKIHSGERPFECEFCLKAFKQKYHLKRHLSWHTGVRPFVCEICSETFLRKSHLTGHIRCHTGERPFKCEICRKAYGQKSALTRHLKQHKRKNAGKKSFGLDQLDIDQIELWIQANFVGQRLQDTGIVQHHGENLGNVRLNAMNCENDTSKDKVLVTQDIKQQPEEFMEIEIEDKSSIEIFKCSTCRFECSTIENLDEHIIENHKKGLKKPLKKLLIKN